LCELQRRVNCLGRLNFETAFSLAPVFGIRFAIDYLTLIIFLLRLKTLLTMSSALAVQQTNFRNDYQKVMVNIMYTSNWFQEKLKKILEQEDITPQQFNLLRILEASAKPLSTLQIRERMLDKMSDTSRIVDRLILKKLVDKKTSTTDKRLVDVTINDSGKELLDRLNQKNEQIDNLASGISEDEASQLVNLLEKIRSK
jgi:DNA-binding MarR family transcriptional regulator